jgi:RNA polymerase sigma-70 factor (ECF subfamily)
VSIGLRYRNNKEDAEFIANKAFLKVLSNLDQIGGDVPFEPWLRRIMINTAIDDFRKEKRGLSKVDIDGEYQDEFFSSGESVHDDLHLEFTAEELESMIQTLPDLSQQVFNLFAIDGYNHQEISEMLSMSEGTSRWHVSSARSKLKQMMKKKRSVKREQALL